MTSPLHPRPGAGRRASICLAAVGLIALAVACGDDDDGGESSDSSASSAVATDAAPAEGGTDDTTPRTVSDETANTDDATPTTADEATADEAGYAAAVAAYLQSTSGVALNEEQAACAAPGWVDVITLERLEASGQSPDEIAQGTFDTVSLGLAETDAQGLLDSLTACDVSLRELFLASVGEEPAAACIDDELTDDSIEQLLREALVNSEPSDELAAEIDRVSEACGLGG